MKILVVQESDWIERNPHQQHHLLERLNQRGHEIHVIDYPIDWSKEKTPGIKYKKETHKNVSKIIPNTTIQVTRPEFIKIKGINYISLYYSHKKEIKEEIKNFKPDIILGLGLLNTYTASKIAKKENIPFVYYIIDNLYALIPEKPLQKIGQKVFQKALKNTTLTLTINKKLKELTIKNGANNENNQVIDAGIDLKEYNPDLDDSQIRKTHNINKDDKVLFFMGYLYHFAGIKELTKYLGENKDKYQNQKLLIVGDGEAYEDLKEIQEKYQLEDKVILTGRQPYNLIPQYLATADYALLPAYQDEEIMQDIVPIKIYEYLAMKKPVISTKLPGIYKEFGEENGIRYVNKAEEVPKIVEKIEKNKEYETISQEGREYVKNNDWEIITDKFEKALKDLLNSGN